MKEDNPRDPGEKWGTQWTSRADAAAAKDLADKRAAEAKVITRTQRWGDFQPSKSILVWCCVGAVALTLIIGFQWGGWHTAKGAATLATTTANAAVVAQLAPICMAQFNLDPEHDTKLVTLKDTPSYQQSAYVTEQLWATMPGAEKPVTKVADACAKLILQANQ